MYTRNPRDCANSPGVMVNMTDGTACAEPTKRNPAGRTGTIAGYLAHRRASEAACGPCKKAEVARKANRRDTSTPDFARYRQSLGVHMERLQAGESLPVCAKPSPDYPDGRTGTRAGYMAHYYADEPACDPCMEGHRLQVADDREADPDHVLRGNLWNHYRLTLERYREILAAQDGKCAICGTASPEDIRLSRFHVDHDRSCCPRFGSCGKCVRGLLCRGCNTALGNFRDDPNVLASALGYLLSHGKERPE